MSMRKYKWKALLSLTLIIIAIVFVLTWLWGVIILVWVIPDVISGKTYLSELVLRKETPILYWAIIFVWLFLAFYLLADHFSPNLLPESWQSDYYTNN